MLSQAITSDYTALMARRIRRILLVCNNYDSFALEEDGHIDVQIAQEYAELNLSNPPAILRAETTGEALGRLGEGFDLIIIVSNGAHGVFDDAAKMKTMAPETPIVLLSAFSKVAFQQSTQLLSSGAAWRPHLHEASEQPIDYFFCWNNSADLIIAIIKLLEDKLNAEHDILTEGVRAIILVEDSVRYYSTYLPLLYKLVLQQNKIAIQDALNEKQQIVRKRARPKVLMATCLDEAMNLYNRYKQNIIGVISDIGFVRHKGDPAESEQLDAGLELCRLIRHDNPTMPFLLQSSQESMRAMAEQMHVGFIVKKSKTLTQELSDYIGREFGFGDFVAIDPRTHEEIGRAHDLEAFEHLIARISPEAFRYLSDNNYLSKWLFARGLFAIGQQVSPLTIKDDSDI